MKKKEIYITGLGTYSSAGYGIRDTWENIEASKTGITRHSSWLNQNIESHLYGLPPEISFEKEIEWDEFSKPTKYSMYGLLACKKAIEDANINLDKHYNGIGMVIETSMGSAFSVEEYLYDLYEKGISKISPMKFTKTVTNTAIGDISRFFKLNGPSSLLLNECSISYGIDLIEKGVADIIICGGIDHYTDYYVLSEQETGGLVDNKFSLDECIEKCNDTNQKVLGEGACFIVLESGDSIEKRKIKPYAKVIDYSSSFDSKNVLDSTKRSITTLRRNINTISKSLEKDSNILWISSFLTDIQRSESEPVSLLDKLSNKKVEYINHKFFTGDMKSASSLFGVLIASKYLQECMSAQEDNTINNQNLDTAIINTVQEGGGNTLFLLEKYNN